MFPNEAQFFCRRCATRFFFAPDVFNAAMIQKKIACPECGFESGRPGDVEKFFKFYPRFVAACGTLVEAGFTFTNYQFTADDMGLFWINSLEFTCRSCNGVSKYPEARLYKYADEPGLFVCKKCKVQAASLKNAKEFFVSYRAVSKASFKLHDFLWDIISPLQLDPADYPVQWPVYAAQVRE